MTRYGQKPRQMVRLVFQKYIQQFLLIFLIHFSLFSLSLSLLLSVDFFSMFSVCVYYLSGFLFRKQTAGRYVSTGLLSLLRSAPISSLIAAVPTGGQQFHFNKLEKQDTNPRKRTKEWTLGHIHSWFFFMMMMMIVIIIISLKRTIILLASFSIHLLAKR